MNFWAPSRATGKPRTRPTKNRLFASAQARACSSISFSSASTARIWSGSARIAVTIRCPDALDRSRTRPSASASIANPTAMFVSAFVDATATSGPACRYSPPSQARAIAEPTTFTSPMTRPPLRLTSSTANAVSTVSPDWLTAM